MRRWLVRLLVLAGLGAAVYVVLRRRSIGPEPAVRPVWPPFEEDETAPASSPASATAARTTTNAVAVDVRPPSARWTDPVEKACPNGFPVKVKLASGIYHLPGMLAYDRTAPDRCYVSAEEAEADGFRAAKR
jgi:hypothetical protein